MHYVARWLVCRAVWVVVVAAMAAIGVAVTWLEVEHPFRVYVESLERRHTPAWYSRVIRPLERPWWGGGGRRRRSVRALRAAVTIAAVVAAHAFLPVV